MTKCQHKNIVNMDHFSGFHENRRSMTSRMCMTCGSHWYGEVGAVGEYTKQEWDKWINSAFDEVMR